MLFYINPPYAVPLFASSATFKSADVTRDGRVLQQRNQKGCGYCGYLQKIVKDSGKPSYLATRRSKTHLAGLSARGHRLEACTAPLQAAPAAGCPHHPSCAMCVGHARSLYKYFCFSAQPLQRNLFV